MNPISPSQAMLLFAVVFLSIAGAPLASLYGYHSAGKHMTPSAAHEETIRLKASSAGCMFGVMGVNQDKQNGFTNPAYTGDEDMKIIDFSQWGEVAEKDMPVFKEQFQRSLVACYRRYA